MVYLVRPRSLGQSCLFAILILTCLLLSSLAQAQVTPRRDQASITGTIADPLGGRIGGAHVTLMRDGQKAGETTSANDGTFTFNELAFGRYSVVVTAAHFALHSTPQIFVGDARAVGLSIELQVGPLQQEVLVTASANEVSEARTAAPVSVIDSAMLDALAKPDVVGALRLVEGAQVIQLGQRGSPTSLFVRGGDSKFNKVLVEGVPANELDGAFDFGQLSVGGVDRVEVLRQSNSVIYGTDALSSVVNITTRRGQTRTPEVVYAVDGGNLGTMATAIAIGGAIDRVDYYTQYSFLDTDNDMPNGHYRNRTLAGRLGFAFNPRSRVTAAVRHVDSDAGTPGSIDLYGLADDSQAHRDMLFASASVESQMNDRWQVSGRFGYGSVSNLFVDASGSGEFSDPFDSGFPVYLGETVTLHGPDGASVTGRAILDFSGPYPEEFLTLTKRSALTGQTTYSVSPAWRLSAGARFDNERVFDVPDDPNPEPVTTRNNGGVFVEGQGTLFGRTFITAGIGIDHHAVFKTAVTPRVSIASYVRTSAPSSVTGDTKLVFNAGKGIKATGVFQEQNSLSALVADTSLASTASPLGPEKGTNIDIGVEQGFVSNQLRVRAVYFRNTFSNLIEFLGTGALLEIGVPPELANATPFGGAYTNAQSYDAQGIEVGMDAMVNSHLHVRASYTYLDAEVTNAFSATPSFNPAFPDVPIGKYSPLVGERPFRRPANSGSLFIGYTRGPAQVTFAGSFAGRRDDSTFLDDEFFGSSMLLPNQGLSPGYAKLDLSGHYQVHEHFRLYLSVENLADRNYAAGFGYRSLPRTTRVGVTVTLGGDSRPLP